MNEAPVRLEDLRFVTGQGRYLDDVSLEGACAVRFLRAPFAHARIESIDPRAAAALPGVHLVLTGGDLAGHGIRDLKAGLVIDGQREAARPVIARDRVRHVGEIVAMVVAETDSGARDALELIDVGYSELPVVADPVAACRGDGLDLHATAPGNIAYDWQAGDLEAVDRAFAGADRVVSIEVLNNRVIINPLEPRGAAALYEQGRDAYTLYAPTQGVHALRDFLCTQVLDMPREKLRVVTGDVGGAFGIRLQAFPEIVAVLLASRLCGRPVRWIAERAEAFLADPHGRAQVNRAELALDAEGGMLACKVDSIADLGAYFSTFSAIVASTSGSRVLGHTYRIPAMHIRTRGVFTNTSPIDSYRGAGKPELVYLLERLVEKAARERGEDANALRRLNILQPHEFPIERTLGPRIDCGDFNALMNKALELSGWEGFEARRADAKARGRLAGIGLGFYVHAAGAFPGEFSKLEVDADGEVRVWSGHQTGGQGHETAFAQVVASRLGITVGQVRVIQGDSDDLPGGGATGGSNAMTTGAVNMARASVLLIEQGKQLAAAELEAAAADIGFADGQFQVAGTDLGIGLFDLARRAPALAGLPEGVMPELSAGCGFEGEANTYPNGCHVAEVEVDPETGIVELRRYSAVDDIGAVLNGAMAQNQIIGGIAQSLGQAMLEGAVYDRDSGQLLSGTLMDYSLPRADDLPNFDLAFSGVPTSSNPLGLKGAGEIGCVGGLAPLVHAVLNALSPLGVTHIDMPLTSEKVWRAIRSGGGG